MRTGHTIPARFSRPALRKIAATGLATSLLATLAACGGDDSENDAEQALNALLVERMRAGDFAPDEARRLANAGMPLTRLQALDAVLGA